MKSFATFTWQELLTVSKGEPVSHRRPFEQASLETDTRTMEQGCFFIPLSGENFNGNSFIEHAYEKQAEGAFVSLNHLDNAPELKRFPNLIAVPDPLITYLSLAQFHRERCSAKIVAITGSSGKTTTKEMLYTMLSSVLGEKVQRSEKNFNNEVGVALTLLAIQPTTEVLILEMGMRGLGQIAILSRFARPDIGIVTNIGPAHIGLLGSIEAIAQAKCEIFSGMDSGEGLAIVSADDPLLADRAGKSWDGCLETFSLQEVDEIHTHADGSITFRYEEVVFSLGLPGRHNVMNALASIKACKHLNIPLEKIAGALARFEPGGGRWQKQALEGFDNLWIINDAYNANPVSMKVALAAFTDCRFEGSPKKVAVIGGMAELGSFTEHYHQEIGEWLNSRKGMDALIVVGEEAKPIANAILPNTLPTYFAENNGDAASLISQHWFQDTVLFLKASRSFHLEEIPDLLKAQKSYVAS